MIQQVMPGEPLQAMLINEIVNWCNDFDVMLTDAVEGVKENIREIIRKQKEPDLSEIKARLTALENKVPTILPAFSQAFLALLSAWQVQDSKTRTGVDTTLYSTGRIDLTVDTFINLTQPKQTETTYRYHY